MMNQTKTLVLFSVAVAVLVAAVMVGVLTATQAYARTTVQKYPNTPIGDCVAQYKAGSTGTFDFKNAHCHQK